MSNVSNQKTVAQHKVEISEIDYTNTLESLLCHFDYFPDIRVFIKDCDARYVYANKPYADMLKTTVQEMIGKSDYDLYEGNIADLYLEEDRKTLSGKSFLNKRWLVPDGEGRVAWCISYKYPLRNKGGKICGIFCTFRDLEIAGAEAKPFFDLAEVVEYIHANYTREILSEDLAEILSVSVSQMNRRFNKTLGRSPINYLLHVRLNAAKEQLIRTDQSVTEIAFSTGFNSTTYFNRQFKKNTNMTPKQYRARYVSKT